jgi:hypothetical protein
MRYARVVVPLLLALAALVAPTVSSAQIAVDVEVNVAPPPLPVYDQPPIPGEGYIWTPGYWAYGPDGYYWVPGTWVEPPDVGVLWTPGYWGYDNDIYVFHAGYWGPHIGFYGGINYGFGYGGVGYEGGYWNHGVFAYNRTVNNFGGTQITNVYNKTVINNTAVTNVSFHGGNGGTTARPTAQEQAATNERHLAPTGTQAAHAHVASTNRALLASVNHGRPAIAATAQPGKLSGHGVVHARETTGAMNPGAAGSRPVPPLVDHMGTGHAQPHAATLATTPRPAGTMNTPMHSAMQPQHQMGGAAPHQMGGGMQHQMGANPNAMRMGQPHQMGGGMPHQMGGNPNAMRMGGPANHPAAARNQAPPKKDKHG